MKGTISLSRHLEMTSRIQEKVLKIHQLLQSHQLYHKQGPAFQCFQGYSWPVQNMKEFPLSSDKLVPSIPVWLSLYVTILHGFIQFGNSSCSLFQIFGPPLQISSSNLAQFVRCWFIYIVQCFHLYPHCPYRFLDGIKTSASNLLFQVFKGFIGT